MSTATLNKISILSAAPAKRFSLGDFLSQLWNSPAGTAETVEHPSPLEIAKHARESRREYLRTQRSLAGY